MFESLSDRLDSAFKVLSGNNRITELNVAESIKEIRRALVAADVNYKIAKDFTDRVKDKALGSQNVLKSVSPGQLMVKIVSDELTELMGGQSVGVNVKGNPGIVLVAGLQGSGKTTFSGKLAKYLKEQRKMRPLLVACDVYRPAAIDQLTVLAESISVAVYKEPENQNPVEIAQKAVAYAKANSHDVVIVDTAGRLAVDEAMMAEVENIKKALNPTETLFVVDSMTGQDAVNTAEAFNARINFDGVVLTKLDGDTRGGAALTIKHTVGKPIKFVSQGEKLDALDVFYPDRMAQRILGMGDMLSLIEKAQEAFDQREAERLSKKLMRAEFNLEDFLAQMQQVKRLGPISQLMSLIPGMGRLKDQIDEAEADRSMKKIEAIIRSMTPEERRDPKILNASRKRRIARGAGYINTEKHPERELEGIQEINALLRQFREMQKMMKMFKSGRGDISRLLKGQ